MNSVHLTPLGKVVVLVALLASIAVVGAAGASADRPHAREWRCMAVRPGDTLWEIARASADGDPRGVVHRIVEENRLAGRSIQPGEGLWVPRERSSGFVELRDAEPESCPAVH